MAWWCFVRWQSEEVAAGAHKRAMRTHTKLLSPAKHAAHPPPAAAALLATHASLRSPNLKARLASAREEFRAVW
jgi:hypothetical protein